MSGMNDDQKKEYVEQLKADAAKVEDTFTAAIIDVMTNAIQQGMPLYMIHTHLCMLANQTLGHIMMSNMNPEGNQKGH